MHFYRETYFRHVGLAAILKNGCHIGFSSGQSGKLNFISIPMGLTVPNLVLVSQFARFFSYPLHYKKLQKNGMSTP